MLNLKFGPPSYAVVPNPNPNLFLAHYQGDNEVLYEPLVGWVVTLHPRTNARDSEDGRLPFLWVSPFGTQSYDLEAHYALFDRATGEWEHNDGGSGSSGKGEASFIEYSEELRRPV